MVLLFRPKKILTKGELFVMDKRVDEIEKLIELCGDNDLDILYNLEKELDSIIQKLEQSLEALQND